jgi:hypothetical protein
MAVGADRCCARDTAADAGCAPNQLGTHSGAAGCSCCGTLMLLTGLVWSQSTNWVCLSWVTSTKPQHQITATQNLCMVEDKGYRACRAGTAVGGSAHMTLSSVSTASCLSLPGRHRSSAQVPQRWLMTVGLPACKETSSA